MENPSKVLGSESKRLKVKKRTLDMKNEEKMLKKDSQIYSAFNVFLAKIRRKVATYLNPENIQNLNQIEIENNPSKESLTNDEDFSRNTEDEEAFEFVEPMVFDLVSHSSQIYLKY